VLLVVDGRAGLLPDDAEIAKSLRKDGKSVGVAVNKLDGANDVGMHEFSRLGFERVVPISAEHGIGVGDLLDEALQGLPRVDVPEEEPPLRLALVGRPNVGKSSILNRLLGHDRAVVSPIPGTTRDALDSRLVRGGKSYLFVDTAGIRRQRLLKDAVDHVSVVQSKKSIERADVVILVLSAEEGLREMDAAIGGYAVDAGKGLVLAVNKWDLAAERELTQRGFGEEIGDHLKFVPWADQVFVSARTGKGLTALLKAAEKAQAARQNRVTTGELNRLLTRVQGKYAPKAEKGGAPVKILYGTQIGIRPPKFVISLSHPVDLHFSYKRYLENQIREAFGFRGTPIVLKVRTRRH
jgi:GTP-binding protein